MTTATNASDRIVESMAEVLVRNGIDPSDREAADQAWRLERYGAGAIAAFGKSARIRAIGVLAVAAALLPLPASAGELVATVEGLRAAFAFGALIAGPVGLLVGFALGKVSRQ